MKKNFTINEGVGKRIKSVRAEMGLSQAKFGDLVGITWVYVSLLENGHRRPSRGLVLLISRESGVSETWLRVGRGKRKLPELAKAI